MLMNRIRRTYRDLLRNTEAEKPIVTVPVTRLAANASNYTEAEKQAQLLRRVRRSNRVAQHSHVGWKVRAW